MSSLSPRIRVLQCFSKTLQTIWLPRRVPCLESSKIVTYSTVVSKCCIDIIDLFVDLLEFNRGRLQCQSEANVFEPSMKELTIKNTNEKVFQHIDFTDKATAKVALNEVLRKNILDQNWKNVADLTEVYMNENVPMEDSNLKSLLTVFSNSGFLKGLLQLRVIMCTSQPNLYFEEGELLMQLATCYWIAGNSEECFGCMKEYFTKYPELKDSGKVNLKKIIYEAVSKRSEAELKRTVSFVKEYTKLNNDFYFIAVLWNYLFLSQWHTDHNLADELLHEHEELRSVISLMSSSMAHHFVRTNRISDIYRLMQVFLKYETMDSYAVTSQILFDYYFRRGNQSACSEIVRTSVRLKSPLRNDQYNGFISWCTTGDPHKYITNLEVKRIYSNF